MGIHYISLRCEEINNTTKASYGEVDDKQSKQKLFKWSPLVGFYTQTKQFTSSFCQGGSIVRPERVLCGRSAAFCIRAFHVVSVEVEGAASPVPACSSATYVSGFLYITLFLNLECIWLFK